MKRHHEYWIGYAAMAGVVAVLVLGLVKESSWMFFPMAALLLIALAMTVAPETKYVKWTLGGDEHVTTSFRARFLFGLVVVLALIPSFALDFPLKWAGRKGFVETDEKGYYNISLTSKAFEKRSEVADV